MDYEELELIIKKKEYNKLTLEHLKVIIRVCKTCKESKTLDNYPKHSSCSYGHNTICKQCFNKKYYKKKTEQGLTTIMKPIKEIIVEKPI